MRATGTSRDTLRARAHPAGVYPLIIHRKAFTLIELLVVISIIALLMAVLTRIFHEISVFLYRQMA